MLYTSYFAQIKNLPPNIIPVSICGKAPDWYRGLQYKKLAPRYGFFSAWKRNHDNDFYVRHFNAEVLRGLNPTRVVSELWYLLSEEIRAQMRVPFFDNPDWHVALVCYERPEVFCHRHLVADWLSQAGFACREWFDDQGCEQLALEI